MSARLHRVVRASAAVATLALAGAACAQGTGVPDARDRSDALAVDAADGIDAAEARRIALAYFDRHVGCGTFTGIADGGERWLVQGVHGRGAAAIRGFTIDKRSGAVASPIGPSYADPQMRIERPSAPTPPGPGVPAPQGDRR
ncbi:MAG: hypothetical protein ACTHOH_12745 [Lysobacteraceae bacterium]